MLAAIPRDASRKVVWLSAAGFTVLEMGFFALVFQQGVTHGAVDQAMTLGDRVGYTAVFLLYNAAFAFAFVRSTAAGRWVGSAVLGATAASLPLVAPTFPVVPATFVAWQRAGAVLLLLSSAGFAFALLRGIAVLARRLVRPRPAA